MQPCLESSRNPVICALGSFVFFSLAVLCLAWCYIKGFLSFFGSIYMCFFGFHWMPLNSHCKCFPWEPSVFLTCCPGIQNVTNLVSQVTDAKLSTGCSIYVNVVSGSTSTQKSLLLYALPNLRSVCNSLKQKKSAYDFNVAAEDAKHIIYDVLSSLFLWFICMDLANGLRPNQAKKEKRSGGKETFGNQRADRRSCFQFTLSVSAQSCLSCRRNSEIEADT